MIFVEQLNAIPLLRTKKMELQLLIQQTPCVGFKLMAPKHGNACFIAINSNLTQRFYIGCLSIRILIEHHLIHTTKHLLRWYEVS
jgi:hypothetical protein